MPKEKEELKEFQNTKRDLTQVDEGLIPEASRDMDDPHVIGGGDPNLSPDAGKPMV